MSDTNKKRQLRLLSNENTFETVWDFNQRVLLDKDIFTKTDMYGQTKYKYKPKLEIMDISVWTGLGIKKIVFRLDEETEYLLNKIDVVNKEISFETDRFGFKKTNFPNKEGSQAVVFPGDSFTEGLYTSPSNTFVNLFGNMMQKDGLEAIPVNMGVNGYSALEMSWMLENYSKHFDTKMVIVNLFPNDVNVNYRKALTVDFKKGYKNMFKYLKKIKNFCSTHDIKLVISIIPPKEQLRMLIGGLFQKRVSEWCKRNKVVFLNPLKYFRSIGESNIYLSWDPHFSKFGHQYYASFLFNHLRKKIEKTID